MCVAHTRSILCLLVGHIRSPRVRRLDHDGLMFGAALAAAEYNRQLVETVHEPAKLAKACHPTTRRGKQPPGILFIVSADRDELIFYSVSFDPKLLLAIRANSVPAGLKPTRVWRYHHGYDSSGLPAFWRSQYRFHFSSQHDRAIALDLLDRIRYQIS